MAERIPQSTSYLVVFRAFLASDGKTPATGKTIAITISKNGGSFGNPNAGATNATEISSGFYKFTLDATDTGTLGPLAWRGAHADINDAGDVLTVVKATNGGFSALPDAAAEAAGGLFTRGTGAGQINQDSNGRIDVNIAAISTDATAADNLEAASDGTGYNLGGGQIVAASVTGAVGSVTGNVGGNVVGNVSGNVTGTVGGFTTSAKAEIQTEAEDALIAHRLDELLNADSDIDGAAPPAVGSVFHELLSKTTGSFTFDQTTDSLEAIRDRGDAAWITGSSGDPWSTTLPGSYSSGQAGFILGTFLDAAISSRVPTSGLPSNFSSFAINSSGHVTVGALANNTVTTASIADGAITSAKFSSVFPANFSSLSVTAGGIVKADVQTILTTAVTEGASGRLANAFSTLLNVASPVLTVASVNQTGDSYARLGAPSGASIAADIAANATSLTTLTGRLTASRAGYLDNLSGGPVALASGVVLAANGMDSVLIESGISGSSSLTNDAGSQLTSINARQALALVLSSAAAGVLSGAATTTVTIKPAGLPSGNTRITATVDADGNRSAMVLKVPT